MCCSLSLYIAEHTGGSEECEPNELDQQSIEELIAESNLNMQILDKNDLDSALHDFVNKDENMAFHSCLDKNIDAAKKKLTFATKDLKAEEDIVLQLDQCMQERMNEDPLLSKGGSEIMPCSQSLPTNTLSTFQELKCSSNEEQDTHESDELIEISDKEHSQQASQKRPAPVDGGSQSSRRKTDLSSFYRTAPSKNNDDGGKKGKAPVSKILCSFASLLSLFCSSQQHSDGYIQNYIQVISCNCYVQVI
ncbi:double-strand break repair protein MRE11-like isoform X2 [Oryza glaberrima]|uniref:double-strand break repair protein MRE11-like isoform X2 n=1 Tax=Oryza glaberrima TaxID=4538 RepID=UPI00224C3911|nr:double-strand break repair protein MRE11-like isoform X2 [Oryza glaberrima]